MVASLRIRRPRSAKITAGLMIVGFFLLMVIVGPLLARFDPSATSHQIMQPPSGRHWLGTTQTGEDVFSQLVNGSRISLMVGVFAAIIATALAVVVGVVSGYARGVADDVLSVLISIFLVIPALPLLIVLAGYLPSKGIESIAVVISITAWAGSARVLRAQTLSLRRRDFIEAARTNGESGWRIIFLEVLPNEISLIAASFLFTVIVGILAEAGLSFLGLGSLTTVSWGSMLYFAQNAQALLNGAWWWFVPPGFAIALVGTGLALLNFGIDEYANPRLRTRTRVVRRALADAPPAESETAPSVDPPTDGESDVLVRISSLSVRYDAADAPVRAVRDVDLVVRRGELLGLAGESGSGKSTLASAVARLLRPPATVVGGAVRYYPPNGGEPINVLSLDDASLRRFRWSQLAVVFQSAMNSLNPVLRIGAQFDDVLRAHRPDMSRRQRAERAAELMRSVGIDADRLASYPHELSGGMRQRAAIAIALALDPEMIIMDEPTTALDVVVQREILRQILALRNDYGFAVLFITHDMSLLLEICDRIAIMYGGRIVESGPAADMHRHPTHPYTRGLLQSFPRLRGERQVLTGIPGTPPDLSETLACCSFTPRCGYAFDECARRTPQLLQIGRQHSACLLHDATVHGRPPPELAGNPTGRSATDA